MRPPAPREARRAVSAALEALTADLGDLELALERRDPSLAARALRTQPFVDAVNRDVLPILRRTLERAGAVEGRRGRVFVAKRESARLGLSFDLTNPRVAAWAQRETGKLIVEIGGRARDSIRALVVQALKEGGHPYVVARQIRPLIGLHSRWATAVLRLQQRLTTEGVLSSERIASITSSYYSRLLATRAETIARTEILSAENAGRAETWLQAIAAGILPPDAEKEWVAAPDAEEVCAGMDGQVVGIDEEFDADEFGSVDMPPAHPNCRCTAVVLSPTGEETGEELSA